MATASIRASELALALAAVERLELARERLAVPPADLVARVERDPELEREVPLDREGLPERALDPDRELEAEREPEAELERGELALRVVDRPEELAPDLVDRDRGDRDDEELEPLEPDVPRLACGIRCLSLPWGC